VEPIVTTVQKLVTTVQKLVTTVEPICPSGMIACGGLCLPGADAAQCCLGPLGNGILCDGEDECCDGFCMAKGTGCADPCGPGLVKCGLLCLPGTDDSVCCEGPGGYGTLCGPGATCCNGICGAPGAMCCEGPTGDSIVCDAPDECCGGLCMAAGTGCAETCMDGTVKCGHNCLPDTGGKCCVGPTGHGIQCGASDTCCGGLCGAPNSTCCEGPTGHSVICGATDECCGGVCFAAGTCPTRRLLL
jgi:hypothetical protein